MSDPKKEHVDRCEMCKTKKGIIRQITHGFDISDVYYGYYCDECSKKVGGK